MQPFFITSTGTGIGKTLITTTLCWQLRQAGKKVTALKPVISGFDASDHSNDSALILKSCGVNPTPEGMNTISRWRYKAALAPNMAAETEGNMVELAALTEFCKEHEQLGGDVLLVEGVGGIMAPLSKRQTVLDWMDELKWPVILVAGTYLGSLSHTLSALEVLRSHGHMVRALVVSESKENNVGLDATLRALEHYMPAHIPMVKIPRLRSESEVWKTMPLISWMCE